MVIAAGVGAGATAWAATSLLSPGSPVPFQRGAPIAGRAQGAPVPGTVKLLADNVADPDGGPPWGLRYWQTDRKYACVQVGRVYAGKLGQISGANVFHELPLGLARGALGGSFVTDGAAHGFVAIHTDAESGAQQAPCVVGVNGFVARAVRLCAAPHRSGPSTSGCSVRTRAATSIAPAASSALQPRVGMPAPT